MARAQRVLSRYRIHSRLMRGVPGLYRIAKPLHVHCLQPCFSLNLACPAMAEPESAKPAKPKSAKPAKPKRAKPAKPKSKPKPDTVARGKRQEGGLRNAWSQKDWLLLASAVKKRSSARAGKSARLPTGSWPAIMEEVNAEADVQREMHTMQSVWSAAGKVTPKNPGGRKRPAHAVVTMEKVVADAEELGVDTSKMLRHYPGEATDDNELPLRETQYGGAGKDGSIYEGVSAQQGSRSKPEHTTFQCTISRNQSFRCRNEVLPAYARRLARTSTQVSATEDEKVQAVHDLKNLVEWNRTKGKAIRWEERHTMHEVYATHMLEASGE